MKSLKRILAVAVAAILVVSMTSCSMLVSVFVDLFDKDEVVFDNGIVSVDDKMMGFFLNDHIIDWHNQYGVYVGLFNLDFKSDLKDQYFGSNGGLYEGMILGNVNGNWYDYFMEPVRTEVETYVTYASAAKANGIALTIHQEIEIEILINNLNAFLEEKGYDYSDLYGRGVDEDAVRRCYELMFLAANFIDVCYADLESNIAYEELVEYRENNKKLFYEADCLTYSIQVSRDQMSDEEYGNACNSAMAAAEEIAKAEYPETFVYYIYEYEHDGNYGDMPDYEIGLDLAVDEYLSSFKYGEDEGELGEFLFGESPAEMGDTTVIEVYETRDGNDIFTVTVYFAYDPMHYNDELTHDFAYAISDDMHFITDLKSEFEASADKSLDAFVNIASKIEASGAPGVFAYASVEHAESGWFETSGGQDYRKLDYWLDSQERCDRDLSDVITLEVKSTDLSDKEPASTRYALVYFDGYNAGAWYVKAQAGVLQERIDAWYESYISENPISVTDEINEIETIECLTSQWGGVIGGGMVTTIPNGNGNDSFIVTTPIPEGGIVISPGQDKTDEKSEESESKNEFDVTIKEDVSVSTKVPVSDSTIRFELNVGGISLKNYGRDVCYVNQYGFAIYYPAIPNCL